jgi:hypothetical protein
LNVIARSAVCVGGGEELGDLAGKGRRRKYEQQLRRQKSDQSDPDENVREEEKEGPFPAISARSARGYGAQFGRNCKVGLRLSSHAQQYTYTRTRRRIKIGSCRALRKIVAGRGKLSRRIRTRLNWRHV